LSSPLYLPLDPHDEKERGETGEESDVVASFPRGLCLLRFFSLPSSTRTRREEDVINPFSLFFPLCSQMKKEREEKGKGGRVDR
jgi:hypothetical protein